MKPIKCLNIQVSLSINVILIQWSVKDYLFLSLLKSLMFVILAISISVGSYYINNLIDLERFLYDHYSFIQFTRPDEFIMTKYFTGIF